jgi:predicted dehydrogenase
MTIDCLRAGKHVIVEKPPSNTVAGAQKIVDAVRKTGGRCMIGVTNRFRTEMRRLKAIIERGDLGARAQVLSVDNVGRLSEGFNEMVEGLRRAERFITKESGDVSKNQDLALEIMTNVIVA